MKVELSIRELDIIRRMLDAQIGMFVTLDATGTGRTPIETEMRQLFDKIFGAQNGLL